jgi:hypothetical protein
MKSLCLVLSGCLLFAGAAQAHLVPASARDQHAGVGRGLTGAGGQGRPGAPDAAAAQDVPALTDAQKIAKPRSPGDLPDVMDLIVKTFKLTAQ